MPIEVRYPAQANFVRKDRTTELIALAAAKLSGELESKGDFESCILEFSAAGDWLSVAAAGWVMEQKWPNLVRGYLAQCDGFFNLLLRADALEAAVRAIRHVDNSSIATHRLLRSLNYKHRWDLAVEAFFSSPAARNDEKCLREIFPTALALKNFEAAELIKSFASGLGRTYVAFENDLTDARSQWEKGVEDWRPYAAFPLPQGIAEATAAGKIGAAITGSWLAFQGGRRDQEFFDVACRPLPTDQRYASRLFFFRHLAYLNHPNEMSNVIGLAKTMLHWRLVDDAHRLLNENARAGHANFQYQLLSHRARSFSEGSQDTPIIHGPLDQIGINHVLAFDVVRQTNSAALKDHAHTAERLRTRISEFSSNDTLSTLARIGKTRRTGPARQKLRIAVCISGQMRCFAKNAENLKRNLIAPLNAEVFVHTWDTQPSAPPEFRHLSRFLGEDLVHSLPEHLRQPGAFRLRFPAITEKITKSTSELVTEEWIRSFLDCQNVVVETEAEFEGKYSVPEGLMYMNRSNQAKMFYKMHACNELRKQVEVDRNEPYDVVVRVRPDLDIAVPNLMEYAIDSSATNWRIYVDGAHGEGLSDLFALGSSDAMDAYCSIWPFLISQGRFDYGPAFVNEPAETLLGQHLAISGVESRLLPAQRRSLLSDVPLDRIDIREELDQDCPPGSDNDVTKFVLEYKRRFTSPTSV